MGKKWNKKALAAEFVARLKKDYSSQAAKFKEDMKWKNIKRDFTAEWEQFKREVKNTPQAYQESWQSLKEDMPNLNPAHVQGVVKEGVVTGVKETIYQISSDFGKIETIATISKPKEGTTRQTAYDNLTLMWGPEFELNLDEIDGLAKRIDGGEKDFEFLQQTGHGSRLSTALYQLKDFLSPEQKGLRKKYEGLVERLEENVFNALPATTPLTSDYDSQEKVLRDADQFFTIAMNAEERFRKEMDAVAERCRKAISFEAIKAYVLKNDENETIAQYDKLKEYADMVGDGVNGLLSKVKHVPDYHTKAATMALSVTGKLVGVIKDFASKQFRSMVVANEVKKWEKTHGPKAIQTKLNQDPMAVPEMLADKIVESVKLSLKCAEPLVAALDKLVDIPVISIEDMWEIISTTAVSAVRGYEDGRLEKARELPKVKDALSKAGKTPIDDNDPLWRVVHDVLTTAEQKIGTVLENTLNKEISDFIKGKERDVVSYLQEEVKTVKDSAKKAGIKSILKASPAPFLIEYINNRLVAPLVAKIVAKLPVTPAQPVSGDDVSDLIAKLGRDLQARGITIVQEATQPRPEHDSEGNAVACVLSAEPVEYPGPPYQGRKYLNVRMADPKLGRGLLFLDNLEFTRPGALYKDPYQNLPEKDARGRNIDEFRKSAAAGKASAYEYEVRIGELWGYLNESGGFTPRKVDRMALSNWRDRRIAAGKDGKGQVRAGYYSADSDEMVAGRWYCPFPKLRKTFYLFMPDSGQHEWADGSTPAGNGGTVAQILENVEEPGERQFLSIS